MTDQNIGHGRRDMAEVIVRQVTDVQYCSLFGHSIDVAAPLPWRRGLERLTRLQ